MNDVDSEDGGIDAVLGEFEGRDKLKGYGIDSVQKLASEYLKAQEHISSSKRVPGENASSEEWAKFYRTMGAPESPDGYETPEMSTDFRSIAESLKPTAKELGLTTKQFNELVRKADETSKGRLEEIQKKIGEAREKWMNEGKEKYGDAFQGEIARAERAFDQLASSDENVKTILDATGLRQHPGLVELFAKAYRMSGEHEIIDSEDSGAGGVDHTMEAKEHAVRIKELVLDKAFKDRRDPKHQSVLREYNELQSKLKKAGFKGALDPRLELDKPGMGYY